MERLYIILQRKVARHAQRSIYEAAIEKEDCRIEAEKADNAAHDQKDPTDGLAQECANACLVPGRRQVVLGRKNSLVGGHETTAGKSAGTPFSFRRIVWCRDRTSRQTEFY